MDYAELQKALKVFGLGDRTTLKEIKARHRGLVKRYHPDGGGKIELPAIQEVTPAYGLLLGYVQSYSFSFAEEEFYKQCPEE